MLKLIFWTLLAANAALIAVHAMKVSASEPATTHQPKPLNPEKLNLVSPVQATAAAGPAAQARATPDGAIGNAERRTPRVRTGPLDIGRARRAGPTS